MARMTSGSVTLIGLLLRLVVVWLCGGACLASLNKIRVPLAVGLLKFSDAKFLVSAQLWIVMMYPYFLGTTIWDPGRMPYVALVFLGVFFY